MSGRPPDSPPETPKPDKGKGKGKETDRVLGSAKFEAPGGYNNTQITGSVTLGHVYAYEVVVATINVIVDSTANVNEKIQEFMTESNVQLEALSDKVGAATNIMVLITTLVVRQANREGINVNKDVKDPTEPQPLEPDMGTSTKGLGGIGKETTTAPPPVDERDVNEVLTRPAIRHILEAARAADNFFTQIAKRIDEAKEMIPHLKKLVANPPDPPSVLPRGDQATVPGPSIQVKVDNTEVPQPAVPGMGKIELSAENKKDLRLSKEDIEYMEHNVDFRKNNLLQLFTVFQFVLNDERLERMEHELQRLNTRVASIWQTMRRLEALIVNRRKKEDDPGPWELPDYLAPDSRPRRLLDPARLVSLYVGWAFYKSLPPPSSDQVGAQKPSWRYAVPIRIPFSTEELFLRVLAQVAQRASVRQRRQTLTLQDDYGTVLKRQTQRMLVDDLLRAENGHLQMDFPQLEWTIAGLEAVYDGMTDLWATAGGYRRKKRDMRAEVNAFEVILKTQWRVPNSLPSSVPGATSNGSGIGDRAGQAAGGHGTGSALGLGIVEPGVSPRQGHADGVDDVQIQGGLSSRRRDRHAQSTESPIVIEAKERRPPGRHASPSTPKGPKKATKAKHGSFFVVQEPQFVLVKTGARGGEGHNHGKSGWRSKSETKKHRLYVEVRQPGIYGVRRAAGDDSDDKLHEATTGPEHHRIGDDRHPYPRNIPLPSVPLSARFHVPPRMPSPTGANISIDRDHGREQRLIQIEGGQVAQELLAEFSELAACDRKGKKKAEEKRASSRPPGPENVITPGERYTYERVVYSHEVLVNAPLRERERERQPPRPSLSRMLMRRVERESAERMAEEEKGIYAAKQKLKRMAARPPAPQMATQRIIPPEREHLHDPYDLRDHRQRVRQDYEQRLYEEQVNCVTGISSRSRPRPQRPLRSPHQTEAGPSRTRVVIQEHDNDHDHFHGTREGSRFLDAELDEEEADVVEESVQWIRRRRQSLGQPQPGDQARGVNSHTGPREGEQRPPRVRIREQGNDSGRNRRRNGARLEDEEEEDAERGNR